MRQIQQRVAMGVLGVAALLEAPCAQAAESVAATTTKGDEYQLVWSDEFNVDGPLNPKDWNFEQGFVRNEELQWYQPENAVCKGGYLVIEGRREHKANPRYVARSNNWRQQRQFIEYTAASVTSARKHEFQFGRFEIRARINTEAGSWPAFWTLGVGGRWPANGEVDIMEYYDKTLLANVAWLGEGGTGHEASVWNSVTTPLNKLGQGWSEKFHVWRMDWDASSIKLYCDDTLLNSQDLSKATNAAGVVGKNGNLKNPFQQPMYLLLNQAIGGERGGDPSRTAFPIRYEIDYVRVYQRPSQIHAAEKPPLQPLDVITQAAAVEGIAPTGLSRGDYLAVMKADIDYSKQFQRDDGAIVDPIAKREIQYSTPAFAAAAGLLVRDGDRRDLIGPASKALSCSLAALLAKKTADGHSDFYVPLIMQAYDRLAPQVDPSVRSAWEGQLNAIDPHTMYHAELRQMNWNIVSSVGEELRRKTGAVPAGKRDDQAKYLDDCFSGHLARFTKFGLYEDPDAPLAYDAFARYWLEVMMASGAYDGKFAAELRDLLDKGGLNTLLLVSPTGEWASGGRSAFHQWNEAQLAAISEIEAAHWKARGRSDVAGAFKRAAHLALESLRRWQRLSGEMWIVKNCADPAKRFAFEGYSYDSQYNLLPMAMLATAYEFADDTIAERPTPAQAGGYVLDLRDTFNKVAAAAGGCYVLIDTAADPHYNATGLQRIARAGVPFSPLSDSTAGERSYGSKEDAKLALSPGLEWKRANGQWLSLASFGRSEKTPPKFVVKDAQLVVRETSPESAAFEIDYTLEETGGATWHLLEQYQIGAAGGVTMSSRVSGDATALHLHMPALVSDGDTATHVDCCEGSVSIEHQGCTLTWNLLGPLQSATAKLDDAKTISHQGYVQPLIVDVPSGTNEVRWSFTLKKK